MILEEQTLKQFGYSIDSLTKGSKKRVMVLCEYCNNEYDAVYKNILNSRDVISKDACIKCKYLKMKECNLKKYGVENAFQRSEVKDKIKDNYGGKNWVETEEFKNKYKETINNRTGLDRKRVADNISAGVREKYGVDNVSQVPEIRGKVQQTCLEKYGATEFFASEHGQRRIAEGMMEKYGVTNAFTSEVCKEKSKATNLDKYGVAYACQNQDVQNKIKETNLAKYGVENPLMSPEIQEKVRKTNTEKYGTVYIVHEGKTVKEWAEEKNVPYSTLLQRIHEFGIDKALTMTNKETGIEYKLRLILEKHGIKYNQHAVINKRRSDFVLPEYNIVLEADGSFWHSEACLDKQYHHKKRIHYIKHGYRPFFFRENEINEKPEIIESILVNAIGKSNRVFARKCIAKQIDKQTARAFFKENHLMGASKGITYGLYHDGKLISAIQMRRKDNGWEIARFCHAKFTTVIGGLTKLLSFFSSIHKPESVMTFIDFRYGSGDYLLNLGFTQSKTHLSFKWIGDKIYNRMQFPGNSGYEYGLLKIYDCGQGKFTKNY